MPSRLTSRHRPVWPIFVAMIPFVAMAGLLIVWPNERLAQTALVYVLLLWRVETLPQLDTIPTPDLSLKEKGASTVDL